MHPQSIAIRLHQFTKVWFFGIASLTIASFLLNLGQLLLGASVEGSAAGKALRRLARLLNVSLEYNIPTWYQAIALFLCGLTLAVIAMVKQQEASRWTQYWRVLSLIFFFLSLDEAAELHELLVIPAGQC